MRGAAAGEKKVGQILAIRNAFGVGAEGVSSVSNNLSLAIRKWRVEGGAVELPFDPAPRDLRMNRATARFTEARAAWTMYPPCRAEISARLMIAQ